MFSITLRNDNVQEIDTRWDEILLSMTKMPSDDVLECLYKLRIRESEKLKTVLELYKMEIHLKISMPNCQKLKTLVKRCIEQKLQLRNFDAKHGRIKTGAVVKSRKGPTGVEGGKRYFLPVERKRPVFERRPIEVGRYSTCAPNGIIGPLIGCPKRLS